MLAFAAINGAIPIVIASEVYSYPGGVAQITVAKESDEVPNVKFGLNEPVIIEYKQHWRILIGLSLDTLPGEYVAYIKPGFEGATAKYEKVIVKQHIYPFKEYSELNAEISNQAIVQTHKSFSDIDFSNTQQPTLPLSWPVKGKWSENFGHKLYDQKKATLHTPNAMVISTDRLSTVLSPQSAIVSKIETTKSGLYTVFLDHGRGLYSILSGLSDITVELGNGIVAGAVIGKLPAGNTANGDNTPLATRRLIWQTVINNTYIDPLILTKLKP